MSWQRVAVNTDLRDDRETIWVRDEDVAGHRRNYVPSGSDNTWKIVIDKPNLMVLVWNQERYHPVMFYIYKKEA